MRVKKTDTAKIKSWMENQGLSQKEAAKAIGVSPGLVSTTVRGYTHNKRVIAFLVSMGADPGWFGGKNG